MHNYAVNVTPPTIPGGGTERPKIFATDTDSLKHHYDTTMRQFQSGGDHSQLERGAAAGVPRDTLSGALSQTSSPPHISAGLNPSVADAQVHLHNAAASAPLAPETLSGGVTALQKAGIQQQQAAWLQKAELSHEVSSAKNGEKGPPSSDTISAVGPDAQRHMETLSITGNPHFVRGYGQDTIQAVSVTVSGGRNTLSDTISGNGKIKPEHHETSPFSSYTPFPAKELNPSSLTPAGSHKDLLPNSNSPKALAAETENAPNNPEHSLNHKIDPKEHLVDVLHQVDRQVTIDLGEHSGISAASEASKTAFHPDNTNRSSVANTNDVAFAGKKPDDSLITMLDEEQKKKMAASMANITLHGGPFGGGH